MTGVRKKELKVLVDKKSRGDFGLSGIFLVISSATFTKKALKILVILLGSYVTFPSLSLLLLIGEELDDISEMIVFMPDHSFFIFWV